MKRKMSHAVSLTALTLLLCALSGTPRAVADTDVIFNGTLVADPCEVHIDSEDQIVDFRNIPSKTFIEYHRSEPERFSIRLTECDLSLGETVKVTFVGAEDGRQTGLFAVTGTAQGLAIAIEDEGGSPVLPNVPLRPAALTAGDTYLNFRAFVSAPVHSQLQDGDFECVTTFLLEYD